MVKLHNKINVGRLIEEPRATGSIPVPRAISHNQTFIAVRGICRRAETHAAAIAYLRPITPQS
jgi:hypothetical protein